MKIKIFTTGGTIDKVYFDAASQFEVGEPQIGGMLTEAGVSFEFTVEQLMRKDSLEMTAEDREQICRRVTAAPEKQVLITHGTDTMVDTARALAGLGDKVIVMTGSLAPARFRNSDALFNIGMAVAAVQTLPPGVYITMSGRVFDAFGVRKNRDKNRFEPA